MLIIRRDLETILQVMDRFNLKEEWNSVNLDYTDTVSGYDLKISFFDKVNGIHCTVSVDITKDTLGDNDDD